MLTCRSLGASFYLFLSRSPSRTSIWDKPRLLEQLQTSPLTLVTSIIHNLLIALRPNPSKPTAGMPPITVVCISDTHSQYPSIPNGDLLIHAGDLTNSGSRSDIQKTINWLNTLPHLHKVVVAGNHDNWLDPTSSARKSDPEEHIDWGTVIYLEYRRVELEFAGGRSLKVYGAPGIPYIGNGHAFQYNHKFGENPFLNMPEGIDILITHTPPATHLDNQLGCFALLTELWRVKPILHVFGHCHSGYGTSRVYFDAAQHLLDALKLSDAKTPQDALEASPAGWKRDIRPSMRWLNAATVIIDDILAICSGIFLKKPLGGEERGGSLLLNAAMMYCTTQNVTNPATLVVL